MTRRGKIARLPKKVREALNRRLENGEPMEALAEWLNGMRQVKWAMKLYFKGELIRDQNISEWKAGGFVDWMKEEEARGEAAHLRECAEDLAESAGGTGVSDCVRAMLAVKMAEVARRLCEEETDAQKLWARLCEVNMQFSRLCRDDHRRVWTVIKRERWEKELEAIVKKKKPMSREEREERIKQIYATI